ncbi:thiamine phosphate synthase [Mobilicoccus pelagius]|uniref:Thiamine-phosphate synthase n=1 Tax=Mobilicoccus pelagius NBRC 104925 TaxID=1089455 RepID=H5UUF3_9MICO|nr:thiamine phosphate synthase [Mobilicoccus pelagius]GAB49361.1 thiamine-phosphate pyrophosphorylase [Mobilicoccus pelagius NBRC 104925]
MTRPACDLTLYLVTDTPMAGGPERVADVVRAAVDGGATLVQVRDPHASDDELVRIARSVVTALRGSGVPVLLNDRVHLVEEAGADGAHVGQSDTDPITARRLLGPDRLLGLSCQTLAHVETARALPEGTIDHVGLGPVFDQTTKPDAAAASGLDTLTALVAESPWPTVAIGGITVDRIGLLPVTGVDGAAVVSAICATPDPREAAATLLTRWKDAPR